LVYNNLLEQVP